MTQEQTFGSYSSFKELFLSYLVGFAYTRTVGLIVVSVIVASLDTLLQNDLLYRQQAIGNPTPDIYIEREGVKYFSQIDEKSIKDNVKGE